MSIHVMPRVILHIRFCLFFRAARFAVFLFLAALLGFRLLTTTSEEARNCFVVAIMRREREESENN